MGDKVRGPSLIRAPMFHVEHTMNIIAHHHTSPGQKDDSVEERSIPLIVLSIIANLSLRNLRSLCILLTTVGERGCAGCRAAVS